MPKKSSIPYPSSDRETTEMVVVGNPENLPELPHVENVKFIVCDNCIGILAE